LAFCLDEAISKASFWLTINANLAKEANPTIVTFFKFFEKPFPSMVEIASKDLEFYLQPENFTVSCDHSISSSHVSL
jgi:hypothetical protein